MSKGQVEYKKDQLKGSVDLSATKADPDRTKQSFVAQCDINHIMERAKKGASLSHLANFGGQYGDFSNWDEHTYENMLNDLSRANTIFADLPAELRNEFDNNVGKFMGFVNDPENKDRLEEIFPVLAEPGRQFPDVIGNLATQIETLNNTVAAASTNDAPPEGATE